MTTDRAKRAGNTVADLLRQKLRRPTGANRESSTENIGFRTDNEAKDAPGEALTGPPGRFSGEAHNNQTPDGATVFTVGPSRDAPGRGPHTTEPQAAVVLLTDRSVIPRPPGG